MASNTIKGLTVEIGGDTTKLSKAIKDVEAKSRSLSKELGDINKLLKLDPGNMDLLGQKQKVLGDAAEAAAKKLETLKEAERQVQEQFERGEVSEEQLRALQREIVATENKMKGYQKAAQQTAQKIEQLGDGSDQAGDDLGETGDEAKKSAKKVDDFADSADKAEKSSGNLGSTLASAAKTGLAAIGAACGAAIAGLTAAAESTREYRTEMGKLDAAFTTAGHNGEAAAKTYETLQGVIGETDQSVEAAQQIALLARSEEDAANWAGLAAGVVGRFGDALQPETFYESANETLKLNEATGAYTQLLEGCGYSVEKFNKGLAACKTEQEKQAYMLSITDQLLGDAADKYRETNAEVIRANEANEQWMQSLAGVGGAIEPVLTDVKLLGAGLLQDLVPGVQKVADAFRGVLSGDQGAAADLGAALSGLITDLLGKVTELAPTVAQVGISLITTLATSLLQQLPTIAQTAVSLIGTLVTTLGQQLPTLIKTGGQVVSQLLSGIATGLPNLAQSALDIIGKLVSGLQTYLPQVLAKGGEILMNLATGIKNNLPSLVSQALDIIMNFAQTLYDNAPTLIKTGFDVLSNLVQGILDSLPVLLAKGPEIISKFANIINDNFPTILKKGVELIVQIVKGIISAIPTLVANIPKIVTAIVDVFEAFNWLNLGKSIITFLKNGITSMVGAVKGAGKNVFEAIMNAIKSLPSQLGTLGKNALNFLKNAITNARGAVASSAKNIFSAVVNSIKSLPSNLLNLGKNAISKLAGALSPSTIKAKASSIVTSVVNTFKSLPGKMKNIGKEIINGVISGIGAMVGKLYDSIQNALGGLVKKAKKALGINSPSKVFADQVGRGIPEGVAVGAEEYTGVAEKAVTGMADDVVNAANAELAGRSLAAPRMGGSINGIQLERNLQARSVATQGATVANAGLSDKLDKILAAIERGQVLTIDRKVLVGATATDYDKTLGQRQVLAARGAL